MIILSVTQTSAYDDGFDAVFAIVTCLDDVSATKQDVSRMFFDAECQVGC